MTIGLIKHLTLEEPTNIQWVKVNGHTSMSYCQFYRGEQLTDLEFASPWEETPQKLGLHLKEGICSYRSKFFPLRVDPIERGGRKDNGRVATPESVSIHLNTLPVHICIP